MTVYFITIILVAITSYVAQRNRGWTHTYCQQPTYKFFVFITATILIFVAGLRYNVGTDYMNYAMGYRNAVNRVWEYIITFNEPGYNVVAWLGSFIYDHYATTFFLVSVITVGICVYTIGKYSDNFCLGILLYIFIGAWHGSFNGMRQYLAAAILFWGHRYLYERKFWKYMLVVFVAMCFHRTAFIMVLVFFLAGSEINAKRLLSIVIVALVLHSSSDVLFDIMGILKGTDQTEYAYMQTDVNILRICVAFAPLFVSAITSRKFQQEPDNAFYINMLIINAAFMFATSSSAYLARVGIYTDIYATIAFPKLIKGYTKNSRILLVCLIIFLYGIFWFYEVRTRSSLNSYQWIFSR